MALLVVEPTSFPPAGTTASAMTPDAFYRIIERLTGTPVKEVESAAQATLAEILSDETRTFGVSQFNELLLLVNKDRVTRAFYDTFFHGQATIAQFDERVSGFQQVAMRRFGNFIYAYRQLSRIRTAERLERELEECAKKPEELIKELQDRPAPMIAIAPIPRDQTHLIGYLSASMLVADHGDASVLLEAAQADPDVTTWEEWFDRTEKLTKKPQVREVLRKLQTVMAGDLTEVLRHLREVTAQLEHDTTMLTDVRAQGERNEDIYLTWDFMDVYFATSMRRKSEYEDLHDFVAALMSHDTIKDLGLRHFDPTQSFTPGHLNKGLVESLMLKRAKCTVYSVQELDTLGKDSELAATLAQGKPVIAYVPLGAATRATDLEQKGDGALLERIRFIDFSLEALCASLSVADLTRLRLARTQLEDADRERIWRWLPAPNPKVLDEETRRWLCNFIAEKEKVIYEKRASTLKQSHPLALQVNLATGVANGVLVARDIATCARLLRGVITNSLRFDLEEEKAMWLLREQETKSVYRVVTKDRKLSNCFWNYYLAR